MHASPCLMLISDNSMDSYEVKFTINSVDFNFSTIVMYIYFCDNVQILSCSAYCKL